MKLEMITRENIPEYLRKGTFYANLDSCDEQSFEVPSDCFKHDQSIYNTHDLVHLQSFPTWFTTSQPSTLSS